MSIGIEQGGVGAGNTAAMSNFLSGSGTSKDASTATGPNLGRRMWSPAHCVAMMRGGIYRRICAIRPQWATKKGWTTGSDDLDMQFRDLAVLEHFRFADTWGRATGEFRLWLVAPGGAAAQAKPLRKGEKILRLQRLSRGEFWPQTYCADPEVGPVGAIDTYHVQFRRPGVLVPPMIVHRSRLLDFWGHDLPASESGSEGWGDRDAIAQVIWSALSGLDVTTSSGAKLASELMVSVFKLKDLASQQTGDDASGLISRIMGINIGKSMINGILLDSEESFDRHASSVSGYRDLSEQARLMLSATEGTPQTLLYGMAPAGFGTDGESWQEMWYSDVAQHQDERYRPHLEYLGAHLAGAEIDLNFRPLGELDAIERASLRLATIQADVLETADGVLTVDERRARYKQGRFMDEFTEGLEEIEEIDMAPAEEIDPADEAAARSLVEAAVAGEGLVAGEGPVATVAEEAASVQAADPDEAAPGTGDGAASALNGAQMAALRLLAEAVAEGKLPVETAMALALLGVPTAPPEKVRAIFAPLTSFEPEPEILPIAAPVVARTDEAPSRSSMWIGLAVDPQTLGLEGLPADAHVTLLYLGEVTGADAADALADCVEAVKGLALAYGPTRALVSLRTSFAAAAGAPIPDVYLVESYSLQAIRDRLLVDLAHRVVSRQHAEYKPHITIGYLPADQAAPAAAPVGTNEVPVYVVLDRVSVQYGPVEAHVGRMTGPAQ